MAYLFLLIGVLSIISLAVGIFKPTAVIKWKKESTRKDVLITYLSLTLISFILVGIFAPEVEKKATNDNEFQQMLKQSKESRNEFEINKITVSDYNLTLNKKEAVTINLLKNDTNYFSLTVVKDKIKKGFTFGATSHNYQTLTNDVDVTAHWNGKTYHFLPNYNNKNFITVNINKFDETAKIAVIEVWVNLSNIDDHNDTISILNSNIITIEDPSFDLLLKTL